MNHGKLHCKFNAGTYCEVRNSMNCRFCTEYEHKNETTCPFCDGSTIFYVNKNYLETCSFCNGKGVVDV